MNPSIQIFLFFGHVLCFVYGFTPRFEHYALDRTRNETGRYRERTNADSWYLCHYQGKVKEAQDLQDYSSKCVEKNEKARDAEEIRENKYPYFYPSVGVPPGCLVPGSLPHGGWYCQGEGKDKSYTTVVPVYHSCWPICEDNYTVSELRDYRCTEQRVWDGNFSGISCLPNVTKPAGPVSDKGKTPEDEERDFEMHTVFIILGSVALIVVVGIVAFLIRRQMLVREERRSDSSDVSQMPLMVNVSSEGPQATDNYEQAVQDSSYGSLELADQTEEGALNAVQLKGGPKTSDREVVDTVTENMSNPDCGGSDDSGVMDNGVCDDFKESPIANTEIVKSAAAKALSDSGANVEHNKMLNHNNSHIDKKDTHVLTDTVHYAGEGTATGDKAELMAEEFNERVTGRRCAMTIDALLNSPHCHTLPRELGHLLDPPHKNGDQKTWKGVASVCLGLPDHEIRALE